MPKKPKPKKPKPWPRLATLFAVMLLCTACAGLSATEVATGAAVTGGALAAIAEIVSPYLSPENQAVLLTKVSQANTMIDAVVTATQTLGTAIAQVREQQSGALSPEAATGISAGAAAVAGVVVNATRNRSRRRELERVTNGHPAAPGLPAS